MYLYILTHKSLINSAKALSREIYNIYGTVYKVFSVPKDYPPAIRWGNSCGEFELDTDLNSPNAIKACSKISIGKVLHGIPHIAYHPAQEVPEHFPIVGRSIMNGAKGKGIVVIKSIEEFRKESLVRWSYWVDFQYELAVHIFRGKIVKVFKKECTLEQIPEFPIRNSERGWKFSLMPPEVFPGLSGIVEVVYNRTGLAFGRLDVGWTGYDYVIIEANTAPCLTENRNTLGMYAENLGGENLGAEL